MKKVILLLLLILNYQILFGQIQKLENKNIKSIGADLKNGFTHWYLKNYNYNRVDSLVKLTPDSIEYSINKLANYLNSISTNEHEKVRSVYFWIINNIIYDHTLHLIDTVLFYNKTENVLTIKDSDTVNAILQLKNVTCGYYAILFNELCLKMHIVSYEKDGWVKTYRGFGYHAWNIVKIYDEYFIIDATWGVDINKYENEFYFLADPYKIIFTHLPDDSHYQLLSSKITVEQFYNLPFITSNDFYKMEKSNK